MEEEEEENKTGRQLQPLAFLTEGVVEVTFWEGTEGRAGDGSPEEAHVTKKHSPPPLLTISKVKFKGTGCIEVNIMILLESNYVRIRCSNGR
jgi:hypothetical protein